MITAGAAYHVKESALHVKPIIPWPGGKRRLASKILNQLPQHKCYVEPFCGAAAILLAKEPSKSEVINDVNDDLTNLYRVMKHHPTELAHQFRWALNSRQMFKWMQDTPPEVLTDIQRAARLFYLQKLCFGGRVSGQSFGTSTTSPPRLNLLRLEEDISEIHFRLTGVLIETGSWRECVARYDRPHTVFFCDPPYWETAGYGVEFDWAEYEHLAEFALTCKGTVVITLNDHPDIRELFQHFNLEKMKISYTPAGGHRAKPATELLITRKRE